MRTPLVAVLVALLVALSLLAPPTLAAAPVAAAPVAAAPVAAAPVAAAPGAAPSAAATDVLPSEEAIRAMLSPLTVSNFEVLPAKDGWDAAESFQLTGAAGVTLEVPVLTVISASELPSNEGAAGFLQTKLQQYRDAVKGANLVGELGAATETLTMDADETYFGAFVTPDGAPRRILTAVHVSRFENVVTAVETTMLWDSPGAISPEAQSAIGVVLGLIARMVNELAG